MAYWARGLVTRKMWEASLVSADGECFDGGKPKISCATCFCSGTQAVEARKLMTMNYDVWRAEKPGPSSRISEGEKAALPAEGEAIRWCLHIASPPERLRGAASAPQDCSRRDQQSRGRSGRRPRPLRNSALCATSSILRRGAASCTLSCLDAGVGVQPPAPFQL